MGSSSYVAAPPDDDGGGRAQSRSTSTLRLVCLSVVIALWLVTLGGWSMPFGPSIVLLLMLMPAWLFVGIAYFVALAVAVVRRGRYGRRMSPVAWALPPVMVVVMASAIVADLPLRARFAASRGSLDAAARDALAGPAEAESGSRWLGLYLVHGIEAEAGAVRFVVGEHEFGDVQGFAYWEGRGEPPGAGEYGYERLTGPWWVYGGLD